VQSQAALLLLLGRQLRGDDQAILARAMAVGRAEVEMEMIPPEGEPEFPVPRLRVTGERVQVVDVERGLAERYGRLMKRKPPVAAGEHCNCRKLSATPRSAWRAGNDAFQLAPDMESLGQIARDIYHENTVRHFALEHGAI